jgi:DNA-binding SARP family transcriptional activator
MQRPSPVEAASRSPSHVGAKLECLGPGVVTRCFLPDAEPDILLGAGKPLAVVAYLVLAPARSSSRERLVDLLWGDRDPTSGRKQLRNALSHLRSRIGSWVVDEGERSCTLSGAVDADVFAFRAAIDDGYPARALDLYRGDFLSGFASPGATEFELWAEGERTHLRSLAVTAADVCCRDALDSGRFGDARRIATRLRTIDPESELGWRLGLEAMTRSGDTLGALAEGDRFENWLRGEQREAESASRAALRAVRDAATDPRAGTSRAVALVADLVGREREFNAVVDAWARARAGEPQLVLISGAAGLGKTRLLEDLKRRLRFRRDRVVFVRGYAGERDVPFSFLVSLVHALTRIPGAAGVPVAVVPTLLAIDPRLSDVYSGTAGPAPQLGALARRSVALQELLAAVSDEQPLALLVDDFHWMDDESRSVLISALSHTPATHLLVAVASRAALVGFGGEFRATTLTLAPLSEHDVENLIASLGVLPADAQWRRVLIEKIAQTSGGTPLLVFAALEQLIAEGVLALEGAEWRFAWTSDAEKLLQRINPLESRIRALPKDQFRLLVVCAIAGVPLPRRVLARAAGDASPRAQTSLLQLERLGHLCECGDSTEDVELAHDAIGETAIALAGDAVRRQVERDFGAALVSEPGERWIERGIRHLLNAGDSVAAYAALSRRVRLSLRRSAHSVRSLVANILALPAGDPAVDRAVRSLPLRTRLRRYRGIMVAGALLCVGGLAAAAVAHARAAHPADASLEILSREDRLHARSAIVPILADRWPTTATLTATWSALRIDTVRRAGAGARVVPGKDEWAYQWQSPDSGGVDVALGGSAGFLERLTNSRADEVPGSWSPDGTELAVETSQFGDSGNKAVGILDVSTHEVRPLSRERHAQWNARWSPDGTRIAFARGIGDEPAVICVYAVDGTRLRCDAPAHKLESILGWTNDERLLVRADDGRDLEEFDTETGLYRRTGVQGGDRICALSPDGQWLECADKFATQTSSIEVMSTRDLAHPKPVLLAGRGSGEISLAWRGSPDLHQYLDSVEIESARDTISVGTPVGLRARGISRARNAMPVHFLRWRSLNTDVATIDSSGVVRGIRPGVVTIEASAAGWRRAGRTFLVAR